VPALCIQKQQKKCPIKNEFRKQAAAAPTKNKITHSKGFNDLGCEKRKATLVVFLSLASSGCFDVVVCDKYLLFALFGSRSKCLGYPQGDARNYRESISSSATFSFEKSAVVDEGEVCL
jgi:hypothetical protein